MRRALLALVVVAAAACEPSGPGPLGGVVEGPLPLGAVVLEIRGTGITGFEGAGDTRTFADPADPRASNQRVVVVGSAAGELRFRVHVEDVSGLLPTATALSAVDANNRPIESLAGIFVQISR